MGYPDMGCMGYGPSIQCMGMNDAPSLAAHVAARDGVWDECMCPNACTPLMGYMHWGTCSGQGMIQAVVILLLLGSFLVDKNLCWHTSYLSLLQHTPNLLNLRPARDHYPHNYGLQPTGLLSSSQASGNLLTLGEHYLLLTRYCGRLRA